MLKLLKFVPDTIPEDLTYGIKSIPEEKANILSHGFGFVLFFLASPFLIYKAAVSSNSHFLTGSVIFCISLLMVYTSSTIYHSVFKLRIKQRLRVFDHISIYFLIAGSFTPFLLVHVQSEKGTWVLTTLWMMVLVGTIFKLFYTHRFKLISTLAYVAMGCMAFFIMEPLKQNVSENSYLFIQLGLVFYAIGVPFYIWKRLYFNHFIWHICVLGGSLSHFAAIWLLSPSSLLGTL